MCLTQRSDPGESVEDARKRMEPKQRAYMRWLTGQGMTAAMTVVHVTWNDDRKAWHYHTHVFFECPAGTLKRGRILTQWARVSAPERVYLGRDSQVRRVLAAGPAIGELKDDQGDADFWNESTAAVAKAVQYPMRDLAQGVTAWRLGGNPEQLRECATQLVNQTGGWKMFRAWGQWRHACPEAVEEEADDAEVGEEKAAAAPAKDLGSVVRVWREARAGSPWARLAFRSLEAGCRNQSDFAKRFVKYCRAAWGPDPPS